MLVKWLLSFLIRSSCGYGRLAVSSSIRNSVRSLASASAVVCHVLGEASENTLCNLKACNRAQVCCVPVSL